MRRLLVAVLALAFLAIVTVPSAQAITRSEARSAAVKELGGLARPDRGRLHIRSTRVAPGARIGQGLAPENVRRVRTRSWLVWFDQAPGAGFAHPSILMLVDDRTGRVTRRQGLSWWPELNGRRLFASARGTRLRPRPLQWVGPPAWAAAVAGLRNDCIVTIGDRTDPYFLKGMAAMNALGARHGMPVAAARRVSDLGPAIDRLARATPPCTDVMIYIAGHGSPAPGADVELDGGGETPETEQPTVTVKASAAGREPAVEEALTAREVRRIMDARPNLTFKVVVESCFSGRWTTLMAAPNLRITVTSSRANEVTFLAVTHAQRGRQVGGKLIWDDDAPVGVADTAEDPPPFTKGFVEAFDKWVADGAQGGDLGAGTSYAGSNRQGDRARALGWQSGRTDDRTRERPHAPVPSGQPPPQQPPGQVAYEVGVTGSYRHIGPGDSEVCWDVGTTPERPDSQVTLDTSGPGVVSGGSQAVRADRRGFVRVRVKINAYGTYRGRANVVAQDGAARSGEGTVEVTSADGTCPPP